MTRLPYVYIIRAGRTRRLKIGITRKTPLERMKELQTGNPHQLRVVYARQTATCAAAEKRIHRRLASYRKEGEWFAVPTEVAIAVSDAIIDAIEEAPAAARREKSQNAFPFRGASEVDTFMFALSRHREEAIGPLTRHLKKRFGF